MVTATTTTLLPRNYSVTHNHMTHNVTLMQQLQQLKLQPNLKPFEVYVLVIDVHVLFQMIVLISLRPLLEGPREALS